MRIEDFMIVDKIKLFKIYIITFKIFKINEI